MIQEFAAGELQHRFARCPKAPRSNEQALQLLSYADCQRSLTQSI